MWHVPARPPAELRKCAEAEQTMGMVAITSRRLTVAEFHAMPERDDAVEELLDGELLVRRIPTRSHQRAISTLMLPLSAFLETYALGEVFPPKMQVIPDVWTAVVPDLTVFPLVNGRPMRDDDHPTPRLVIEVLSPDTARIDRGRKRTLYQRLGVEYWIVDLDAQLVEQWMPEAVSPVICLSEIAWAPTDAPEPFRLELPGLFARVVHP